MPNEQKSDNNFWAAAGICFFLIVLVWVVFGQTLGYGFVNYDDDLYVYKNPVVIKGLTLHGFKWAFTGIHPALNWHPLTTISHMVDCQFFGLNAAGPHFVNVLLHTIAVLLLFLVLWRLTGGPSSPRDESVRSADLTGSPSRTGGIWPSAFVAALFAIHPLHVESVAWISERKDVLSGVFFMLTVGAYAYYVRRPTVGRYLTVSILYALGLMSKPMLVTVPFVLLLLDYWPLGRIQRTENRGQRTAELPRQPMRLPYNFRFNASTLQRLNGAVLSGLVVEKIPLFFLAAASCIAALIVQSHTMHQIKNSAFPIRLSNAFLSYLTYVWQMFWPAHLAAFYPYVWKGRLAVVVAILFLIIVSAQVLGAHRRFPYLVTGWFWYLVMLVPVSGLVQVGLQGHADRYTYLPHIGLYLALTWTVAELSKKWPHHPSRSSHKYGKRRPVATALRAVRMPGSNDINNAPQERGYNIYGMAPKLLGVGAAAVLGLLTWRAHDQTRYWHDSGTLWRHAIAVTRENYVAHNDLAVFLQTGDEALAQVQEALREQPDYPEAHYYLARHFANKGEFDKAIGHLQQTVAFQPYNADAWGCLGEAFIAKGQAREAIRSYEHALELARQKVACLEGLAWILATCPDPAVRDGARAVQLGTKAAELSDHQDPFALRALAAAYAEAGQFQSATAVARRALQLALAKHNSQLEILLKLELDLYQTSLPLRDYTLRASAP